MYKRALSFFAGITTPRTSISAVFRRLSTTARASRSHVSPFSSILAGGRNGFNPLLHSLSSNNLVFMTTRQYAKKGNDKGGKAGKGKDEEAGAEVPDIDFTDYSKKMEKQVEFLQKELASMRTGRASPALIENIMVEAYDSKQPLSRLGQIAVKGPRNLQVNVFDKAVVSAIEKAIREADLNLNPQANGTTIQVPIPKLSKETRDNLLKLASKTVETHKERIRGVRKDGRDFLKKFEKQLPKDEFKRYEKELQDLTDKFIKKMDDVLAAKIKDIQEN